MNNRLPRYALGLGVGVGGEGYAIRSLADGILQLDSFSGERGKRKGVGSVKDAFGGFFFFFYQVVDILLLYGTWREIIVFVFKYMCYKLWMFIFSTDSP